MSKIIPTIFALDEKTFNKKLNKLKFANILHIDFMDSTFTKNSTISLDNIKKINNIQGCDFQLHLMCNYPISYLDEIKKLNIYLVLIHYEVFRNDFELIKSIEKFKSKNINCGIVFSPKTEILHIEKIIKYIDYILIMSVKPGCEGQNFITKTYTKIINIKKKYPKLKIIVDGGINNLNVKKLNDKGCDFMCVGSYISSSKLPVLQYNLLNRIIENS